MPVYEYECGQCHNRFDLRQGFHEEPQAVCPQCKEPARRVFYPTAVVFKGSGFYITDSRKNKGDEPKVEKPKVEKKETATTDKQS